MEIINKYVIVRFNINTLDKNPILQSDDKNELLQNVSQLNHTIEKDDNIRYYVESTSLYKKQNDVSYSNDLSQLLYAF